MTVPGGETYVRVKGAAERNKLRTVCLDAKCPNIGECFCSGHAAFLIMGGVCTRNCLYCAVGNGLPSRLDPGEPLRIAAAVAELGLRYTVITSVTRDDLADGGASHFTACVREIRAAAPLCRIELLIPDFRQADGALAAVCDAKPDVLNHNIEVVRRLFSPLRMQGDYDYSLSVLRRIAESGIPAKSGLMIGFGETLQDIEETITDLHRAGCSILTVGQYLRSYKDGVPVVKYYRPEEFEGIAETAKKIGIKNTLSAPLARSSYHAEGASAKISFN
jgi:lipoic acid synthetase